MWHIQLPIEWYQHFGRGWPKQAGFFNFSTWDHGEFMQY